MTNFRNMKIEVNEQQPLEEVVRELERLGYKQVFFSDIPKTIETYSDGGFDSYSFKQDSDTTLTQLKEM